MNPTKIVWFGLFLALIGSFVVFRPFVGGESASFGQISEEKVAVNQRGWVSSQSFVNALIFAVFEIAAS